MVSLQFRAVRWQMMVVKIKEWNIKKKNIQNWLRSSVVYTNIFMCFSLFHLFSGSNKRSNMNVERKTCENLSQKFVLINEKFVWFMKIFCKTPWLIANLLDKTFKTCLKQIKCTTATQRGSSTHLPTPTQTEMSLFIGGTQKINFYHLQNRVFMKCDKIAKLQKQKV